MKTHRGTIETNETFNIAYDFDFRWTSIGSL